MPVNYSDDPRYFAWLPASYAALENTNCFSCGGKLVSRTSSAGAAFYGCSNYSSQINCKFTINRRQFEHRHAPPPVPTFESITSHASNDHSIPSSSVAVAVAVEANSNNNINESSSNLLNRIGDLPKYADAATIVDPWRTNGGMKIKTYNGKQVYVRYFQCCVSGCKAGKSELFDIPNPPPSDEEKKTLFKNMQPILVCFTRKEHVGDHRMGKLRVDEVASIARSRGFNESIAHAAGESTMGMVKRTLSESGVPFSSFPSERTMQRAIQNLRDETIPDNDTIMREHGDEFLKDLSLWSEGASCVRIVLALPRQIQLLRRFGNNMVYLDGTHGLASFDYQLVVLLIRHPQSKRGIPVAYMLTTRQSTEVYEDFIRVIRKQAGPEWKPTVVMCDFEIAIRNAVKNSLDAVVWGCYFHFCQAVHRHVRKSSGEDLAKSITEHCQKAFYAENIESFNEIWSDIQEVYSSEKTIIEYLGKTWFNVNAKYPPSQWAAYARNHLRLEDPGSFDDNTNNVAESYNRALKLKADERNPPDKLINKLRKDADAALVNWDLSSTGSIVSRANSKSRKRSNSVLSGKRTRKSKRQKHAQIVEDADSPSGDDSDIDDDRNDSLDSDNNQGDAVAGNDGDDNNDGDNNLVQSFDNNVVIDLAHGDDDRIVDINQDPVPANHMEFNPPMAAPKSIDILLFDRKTLVERFNSFSELHTGKQRKIQDRRLYEALGVQAESMKGDGNCAFHMYTKICGLDRKEHGFVRSCLINFVENNPAFFRFYVESEKEEDKEEETWDSWLSRMYNRGEWADNNVHHAFSLWTQQDFIVIGMTMSAPDNSKPDDLYAYYYLRSFKRKVPCEEEDLNSYVALGFYVDDSHYAMAQPGKQQYLRIEPLSYCIESVQTVGERQ